MGVYWAIPVIASILIIGIIGLQQVFAQPVTGDIIVSNFGTNGILIQNPDGSAVFHLILGIE